MLKYIPEDTSITFAEIPDEICLCINISNCPHRCPGCHSQYLQTDIGNILTNEVLHDLIINNNGITCVVFMGGDSDKDSLKQFANYVSSLNLKVGWYSGEYELDLNLYGKYFDYIKIGPYIEELGPLNSRNTNQRLYCINKNNNCSNIVINDITYKFWR